MMRFVFFIAFISVGISVSATNSALTVPDSVKNQKFTIQMTQARVKFQNENFQGALRIYSELQTENPDKTFVNYRMGETYFMLGDYNNTIKYLKKLQKDKEDNMDMLYYYLGRSYHSLFDFENALVYYEKYIETSKKKDIEFFKVPLYLSHVKNAIQLMSKKVDVKIKNLGETINSEYVDAVPSITADQEQLIFTSRRPDNKMELKDPSTGQYYDDVYTSHKLQNGSWSKAELIRGDINTEWHDANTSISPDGKTIFLYKNIINITHSGDIYTSTKNDQNEWSTPIPLKENLAKGFFNKIKITFSTLFKGERTINSSYFETSACITADNNTLYFVSERSKKGIGNADIWQAHKSGSGWSTPRNLGKNINTENDEIGVYIHPDGKTMFFSSNGEQSMGGYDIFMSKMENGKWSKAINLGYPINTPYDEFHFALSTDSKTAYISSNRKNGLGAVDIYEIDMQNYFKKQGFEFSQTKLTVVKGRVVDEEQNPISTTITIKNKNTGKIVSTIKSDKEGKYFATLDSANSYEFIINVKGMKPVNTLINLTSESDKIKTWHFILSKK